MVIVFYPLNEITCVYFVWIRVSGTVGLSNYRLIFDIWGAATGWGNVAHWAPLGGFGGGFLLAWTMLKLGWVEMESTEKSLLDVIRDR